MNPVGRLVPRSPSWLAPVAVLALAGLLLAGDELPAPPAAPLEGAEAEAFLHTAVVVARKPIGSGVTHSDKLTLTDGRRSARAAWKTIDEHVLGLSHMDNGNVEFDYRDSWKHDVAAYELDKLLGLGLVPPTVERRIQGRRGALKLWVEGAMTELRELSYDTDNNVQNTLYGPGFRVYAIDFSRAFRISTQLLSPERLHRLPSPEIIEKLRALDRATVEAHLSPWLQGRQITGLLARRDAIVALVDRSGAGQAEDRRP
jgi:hypothetical protein